MTLKGSLISKRRFRRRRSFRQPVFRVAVLFLIFSGLVGLFHLPKLRVGPVEVRGNFVVSQEEISSSVEQALRGKLWNLFPKDNILILPKEEIKDLLVSQFSRIKDVSVSRNLESLMKEEGLAGLVISVEEREERALWCLEEAEGQEEAGEKEEEKEETCYFLDSNGVIFEPAPFFSGSIFAKFLDQRSQKSQPGEKMIREKEFEKLMEVREFLRTDLGVEIEKIFLKDSGEYEFLTKPGWQIFLSERLEKNRLLENLNLALKEQIKEQINKLDYLDLRFGNKVFYKFR